MMYEHIGLVVVAVIAAVFFFNSLRWQRRAGELEERLGVAEGDIARYKQVVKKTARKIRTVCPDLKAA